MVKRLSRLTCLLVLGLSCNIYSCSRQTSGERCSLSNGDADCEGDLVCTDSSKLRQGQDDKVDRCCPEELSSTESSLCAQVTISAGDGDGDTSSVGGGGGDGGASSEGDAALGETCDITNDCAAPAICSTSKKVCVEQACDWTTDCDVPFVCGPRGTCQVECKSDRDCASDEDCSSDQTCVAK